jgi:hypothetical protein
MEKGVGRLGGDGKSGDIDYKKEWKGGSIFFIPILAP